MLNKLSSFEKEFILDGVQKDIRADGRSCFDYRHLTIETGVLSNTSGSSRLRLAATDVLVGIKVELGRPLPGQDEGQILFSVECSTSASPEFQGRGGDLLSACLTRCLERMIANKKAIDMNKLIIIPEKQCWIIYVDTMILVNGGNVLDAISLAIRAALLDVKIPEISVVEDGDNYELEISDDPQACQTLDLGSWPVLVTLSEIGSKFIVDASIEEECCTVGRVTFGVNKDGSIMCTQKAGKGTVDPTILPEMLKIALSFGKELITNLDEKVKLQRELEERGGYQKLGFLGSAY
jgi:exosome complex component RRP42